MKRPLKNPEQSSLPGLPLCWRSPQVYRGDQDHLWHTPWKRIACGRLNSQFAKSPSTTLLFSPIKKCGNTTDSLSSVCLSQSSSSSSFPESPKSQDDTQATILAVMFSTSRNTVTETKSRLSADVSCGFIAVTAMLIDQHGGLQLSTSQCFARCSFIPPSNERFQHKGSNETCQRRNSWLSLWMWWDFYRDLFVIGTLHSDDSRDLQTRKLAVQWDEASTVNWKWFGIKSREQPLSRQYFPFQSSPRVEISLSQKCKLMTAAGIS